MIFHIARRSAWDEALDRGDYRQSTVDSTLDEEGFIHASGAHQLQGVADRYCQDVVDDLVLLVIDADRLGEVELRHESPAGRDETFPHIYGSLPVTAVAEVRPLERQPDGRLVVDP
ncbi:MAG: DUF952 domain-containing protein [Acidimicrobiia bacterium]|nr:DUF952 domain-containing protein [Acidimicrobiia bacterium]